MRTRKKTYLAIIDQNDPRGFFWGSGLTRKLTEEEAAPLLAKGKIVEYVATPKKFVEMVAPDGGKKLISWGEYLKYKNRLKNPTKYN